QGVAVHFPIEIGLAEQRLDLRSEQQPMVLLPVIERFDAVAVASQMEQLAFGIPQRKRKNAVELPDEIDPPLFVAVQQDFGVGARTKLMAGSHELFAKFR